MIELTDEQRRQLEGPEPIRVRDPQTNETYVLVNAGLYERLRDLLPRPTVQPTTEEVAPGIQRSRAAFLRDLPELLRRPKLDRWYAAYHGDERMGIARDAIDLYRECGRRGLRDDEFYVGIIRPHAQEPEELELSLVENDEPDFPHP